MRRQFDKGFTEHVVYEVGGAITSDGSFVFVVNAIENTVSAIDTNTNEIIATLSDPMFGSEPLGLAITPDNKWVYVANYKSNSILVIDMGILQDEEVISEGNSKEVKRRQ